MGLQLPKRARRLALGAALGSSFLLLSACDAETEAQAALYEVVNGVAWLTFNRPDRLNALNLEMVELLRDYLEQAEKDSEVKVVVVTGAGRGFCSGADLKGLFGSGGAGAAVNTVPQHSGFCWL